MIVNRIAAKKSLAVTLALALGLVLPSAALAQVEVRVAPVAAASAAGPAAASIAGLQTISLNVPSAALSVRAMPASALSGSFAPSAAAAPAAAAQAFSVAAPASMSAPAAMPSVVDAHPVISIINQLQAAGVSLPESASTRQDADRIEAAANALPQNSPVRGQLTQLAASIRASRGGLSDSAASIGRSFDNSGDAPAAGDAAPAPQTPNPAAYELTASQVRFSPAAERLPQGTREIPASAPRLVGQDEAIEAIRFALEMPGDQYNLFVAGPEGSGRETAIRRVLAEIAPTMPTPGDLVAVSNFKEKEKPIVLDLAPGTGKVFKEGVEEFVEHMQEGLVRELSEGETGQQLKQISGKLQQMQQKATADYDAKIAQIKLVDGKFGVFFKAQPTEEGNLQLLLGITHDGKTMTKEEVDAKIASGAFTEAEWKQAQKELQEKKTGIMEGFSAVMQSLGEGAKKIQGIIEQLQEQAAVAVANEAANELVMKVVAPKSSPATDAIKQRIEERQAEIQDAFKAAIKAKYGKFGVGMTQEGGVLLVFERQPAAGPAAAEMIAQGKFTQAELDKAQADFSRKIAAIQQKAAEYQAQDESDLAELKAATPAPTAAERKIIDYIKEMAQYAVDKHEIFLAAAAAEGREMPAGMKSVDPADYFRVSVLADNENTHGAPVIFEENPTFEHLFGTAEDNTRNMMIPGVGIMKSDSQGGPSLKGGSYHKANGGYLVLNALSVLRNPGAWEALMQAVATGKAEIEEGGLIGLLSRKGDAYPVPTKVKVVLVGAPMIQMLLAQHDQDFAKNFLGVAQFQSTIKITEDAVTGFLNFLQHAVLGSGGKVIHLTKDAIGRVLEQAARLADSNQNFTSQFGVLYGLLAESTYWAKRAGQTEIRGQDVEKALTAKRDREETYAKRMMEFYEKNIFRVDTSGSKVGQINGLAVMGSFGVPMRITFVVAPGKPGLVSIDHEAETTGSSFNKALGNEWSFILNEFGQKKPVLAQIRVSHEQNYGGIDGDSATSTTIYGMLSALSGVAIKQNFAVTGSADQFGNVQAIGGINEKVEGFFALCKHRGLTGDQGIVMPKANVADLQLSPEVAKAIADGQFHIYAVDNVRQGIEVLTGVSYDTIKTQAQGRLDEISASVAKLSKGE